VTGAIRAGGVAIAAADFCLLTISWRSRTVLSGVLAAGGIVLVGFATLSGASRGTAVAATVIALILLTIGIALYGLGQALERLLGAQPEDET
jgi:uncharacterized membrane protein